jgi:hypothetical protein
LERAEKKNKKATTSIRAESSFLLFMAGLLSRLSFIFMSIRMVFFSNWRYIALATVVSSIFWTIFNVFDQLLFFSPVFVFYLPDDAVTGFIFSNITAVLLGLVVSMNVYVFRHLKGLKITAASFFSGSTLSVLSSTCASCSSLGFLLVSTFGGLGVTASTFLSNYQIPLRIISVALLIYALYSISNKLVAGCRIKSGFASQ